MAEYLPDASRDAGSSFVVSQSFPGALLTFDPPMHSPELQNLVEKWLPDSSLALSDKYAAVTFTFLKWRDDSCPSGPALRRFAVPIPEPAHATAKSSGQKRKLHSSSQLLREESNIQAPSSAFQPLESSTKPKTRKKYPPEPPRNMQSTEFSVLTPNTIGNLKNGPRGPKTKLQRDHAWKMRKIGSCNDCRKRKLRCQPNHKRMHTPLVVPNAISTQPVHTSLLASSSFMHLNDSDELSTLSHVGNTAEQFSQDWSFGESLAKEGSFLSSTNHSVGQRSGVCFPNLVQACVVIRRALKLWRKRPIRIGKLPEISSHNQSMARRGNSTDLSHPPPILSPSSVQPWGISHFSPAHDSVGIDDYQDQNPIGNPNRYSSPHSVQYEQNLPIYGEDNIPSNVAFAPNNHHLNETDSFPYSSTDFHMNFATGDWLNLEELLVPEPSSNQRSLVPYSGYSGAISNTIKPTPIEPQDPVRLDETVLSLDSTGLRGYPQLLLLKKIMNSVARLEDWLTPSNTELPHELFDMVGGTSTGGYAFRNQEQYFHGDFSSSQDPIMLGRLRMSIDDCMTSYQELAGHVFGNTNPLQAKQSIMESIDQLEQHPELLVANPDLLDLLLLFDQAARLDREARIREAREREAQRIALAVTTAALSVNGNWSQRVESPFQHDSWQHILQDIDGWSNSFPAIAWVILECLLLLFSHS